jgi:hypothetical protein
MGIFLIGFILVLWALLKEISENSDKGDKNG